MTRMTPEALKDLLDYMSEACEMPTVPSAPLIRLQTAISQHLGPTWYGDLDDDDPLIPVIDAAIEVSESWSFYPPEQFGSDYALVDSRTVEALQQALADYREKAR